jgi:hypothetical protein
MKPVLSIYGASLKLLTAPSFKCEKVLLSVVNKGGGVKYSDPQEELTEILLYGETQSERISYTYAKPHGKWLFIERQGVL